MVGNPVTMNRDMLIRIGFGSIFTTIGLYSLVDFQPVLCSYAVCMYVEPWQAVLAYCGVLMVGLMVWISLFVEHRNKKSINIIEDTTSRNAIH